MDTHSGDHPSDAVATDSLTTISAHDREPASIQNMELEHGALRRRYRADTER